MLTERGIETYCPQRPTCDLSQLNVGNIDDPDFDRRAPPGGYPLPADDAAEVGCLIDELIEDGKSVLLAGHSSGGWVAAEAATSSQQASVRTKNGKTGGIIGIFFIGAFIIPEGQSVHSFFQPADGKIIAPPFMRFHVSLPQIIPTNHSLTAYRHTVSRASAQWSTLRNSSSMISTRRPLRNGRLP
jgi:pimeloyl-ACP methyl ester carboxylesterase